MENVHIRRLEITDEEAFLKATDSWDYSSGFSWQKPEAGQTFEDFVQMLNLQEKGQRLPEGYVPATTLFGFINGEIAARLSIRHELNDFLLKVGGHIGYGVIPNFRRKGIATAMLKMALHECRQLGMNKVLVTCNDDNVGSAKTIEKNGGILENVLDPGNGQKCKRRYWIEL